MLQRLCRWIASRTSWWLAAALTCAYWLAVRNGADALIRVVAMGALPIVGALLLAAIDERRPSTSALLVTGAMVPTMVAVSFAMAPRRPDDSFCMVAPLIIAGWLVIACCQLALMFFLASTFRWLRAFAARRRVRSQ